MSSDSEESDGDYVPTTEDPVSEEGSADEDTDLQFEKEQLAKGEKNKRKSNIKLSTRRRKVAKNEEDEDKDPKEKCPVIDKKRDDELWASFLSDTDTSNKPKSATLLKPTSESNPKIAVPTTTSTENNKSKDPIERKAAEIQNREMRIFEFAGEKVIVDNNASKIVDNNTDISTSKAPAALSRNKPGGGISSILSQIGKKNKLSTLEKSKLDWENFKSKEGIKEELNTYNKGKDGYLERQDFLERADLRQFEIEKGLRARKSNR